MILAIDCETDGFDSFNGNRPFAFTTCTIDGKTEYIEVGTDDLVPLDLMLMNSKNEIVGHNLKFDWHMSAALGMTINGKVHDTMVMAFIYNSDEENYKLKSLAKKYLGAENDEEVKLVEYMQKNKLKDYSKVPREIMEPYALKDAVITMDLFKFYRKEGVVGDPVYVAEMQILKCLISMERRGVLIDLDFCRAQSDICAKRIEEIEAILKRDHGGLNVRSNKQLTEYLTAEGIRFDGYTDAGNPSFDEYNLQKYDHPVVPLIIELRELGKIKTTYLDSLIEKKDKDNVIHCSFLQTGARTGRFSCINPNLQNIPRDAVVDVRRAFICRPEYTNYYFDYSQIELRILAHYSQEPLMIEELCKEDSDLHSRTCQAVFGEVTKEKRNLSKNINFGIIYGMGPKKFCEMVNRQYPHFEMTYTQAKMFINKYYQTYPKVRLFTWRVPQKILDVGYVTDIFGRKYTCPRNESYKGVNYLIQGCAAGIIKRAMTNIHTLLEGKKSNLLLTIHDELVVEVHNDEETLVPEIVRLMEDRTTFRVPIRVNVEKTTTDWSQKASLTAE